MAKKVTIASADNNGVAPVIINTYVPTFESKTEEFSIMTGRPLTFRYKDFAASILRTVDDTVEIPVIVTKERVENRIVEVVQGKHGVFSMDSWMRFLQLRVQEFSHQIEFLPTSEEISMLMGDDYDPAVHVNAQRMAQIHEEAMARKYRDTIAVRFLKDNHMYYMQRHIEASTNLVANLNYETLRELALTYNKLYIDANQAITPKQQVDTIGRLTRMMEANDGEISEQAMSVLSSFITLTTPLNMSSVKMVTVPKNVAIDMLAEMGVCTPSRLTHEADQVFDDEGLLRRTILSTNLPSEVLQAVHDVSYVNVVEFLLSQVETRRFGMGFRSLDRFKPSIKESIDLKAKGDPTFSSIHFSELDRPGREGQVRIIADEFVNLTWQNNIFDFLYRGIANMSNPLFMKLQISNDDLIHVAPTLGYVTSALHMAYGLFTSVNKNLLALYEYEAIDRNWSPYSEVIRDLASSKLDLLKNDDDENPAYIFSSLKVQLSSDKPLLITERASASIPEIQLNQVNPYNKPEELAGAVMYETAEGIFKRRVLLRKGLNVQKLIACSQFFIPEFRHVVSLNALTSIGAYKEIDYLRYDKKSLEVQIPDWAKKIHQLTPLKEAGPKMTALCRTYGIEFDHIYFPSTHDFFAYLGGEVMLSDLERLGYDPDFYVTNAKAKEPKYFLIIKSDPMLIRHMVVPALNMEFDQPDVFYYNGQSTFLATNDDIHVSVLPVNYKNENQVLIPKAAVHMESIQIGKFVVKPAVEVESKEFSTLEYIIGLSKKKDTAAEDDTITDDILTEE